MTTTARQRGDRARGAIVREFGLYRDRHCPSPGTLGSAIETAVAIVDKAGHDAEPRIQWFAQDVRYLRPPLAMQTLAKLIARTFGCMWFSEQRGTMLNVAANLPERWYHYGGASKLRCWAAMHALDKTWKACDREAHHEMNQCVDMHHGQRRTFVSERREAWVGELGALLTERAIDDWVVRAWRIAKSRKRARQNPGNRLPPRSMSYEDVERWLDDVVESWGART